MVELDDCYILNIIFLHNMIMNPAHNLFVRKLNKKLYDYKKKMIKYKKAFMFVKNINKNERNETHCDSKHFKIIRKIF